MYVEAYVCGCDMKEEGENLKSISELFARICISHTRRYVDASDYESLVAAFKDVSVVIVASTTTQYVKQVAQAAIDAEIDYHDYHYQHFGPTFGVRSGYPLHTGGGHIRKS